MLNKISKELIKHVLKVEQKLVWIFKHQSQGLLSWPLELQIKGSPKTFPLGSQYKTTKSDPITCGMMLDPRETMYPSTALISLINRCWKI